MRFNNSITILLIKFLWLLKLKFLWLLKLKFLGFLLLDLSALFFGSCDLRYDENWDHVIYVMTNIVSSANLKAAQTLKAAMKWRKSIAV